VGNRTSFGLEGMGLEGEVREGERGNRTSFGLEGGGS
jgi:hypothetical protein